jgi:hypothetical protein
MLARSGTRGLETPVLQLNDLGRADWPQHAAWNPRPYCLQPGVHEMHKPFLSACLVVATLSGCQATSTPDKTDVAAMTACPNDRPEFCTEQYDPVCGVSGGEAPQTYSNACHACADHSVDGYLPGPCEPPR